MDLVKAATGGLFDIVGLSRTIGVKSKTVYSWVHTRQIPHIKVGRLVKFDPQDIEKWIAERKVQVMDIK